MSLNTIAANKLMNRFDRQESVWLFGYGSLIFKADFPFIERRPASIAGWTRRFWQGSHDHRGTEAAPGRVATLVAEPGAVCDGIAYLITPEVFDHLDYREKNGYLRIVTEMRFADGGSAEGLVYIAAQDNAAFLGPASESDIARQIATAAGPSGRNRDYLFDLADALRKLGKDDPHVFAIERHLLALDRDGSRAETPATIREFWFGSNTGDAAVAKERARLWWQKHPRTDAEIRNRFEAWVARAAGGELDAWLATTAGRLALIILTDQFPRNMYRDTPKAFAFDRFALAWCKEGLEQGIDKELRPIERVFFYLPLEHSESIEDQEQSVRLFRELAASMPSSGTESPFDGFLDFAVRHRDIIARFGRFPHRNRILGRASTAEELAFLREKGSSF